MKKLAEVVFLFRGSYEIYDEDFESDGDRREFLSKSDKELKEEALDYFLNDSVKNLEVVDTFVTRYVKSNTK